MKRFDDAIDQCNKGIESTKGKSYDFAKLAKVMARKASALEKKGDFDAALKQYSDALLENNDSAIKDAMKKLEKTKKEAEAKAYINPEIAEAHKAEGSKLFKEGKYPAAIKEYDEGMRRDPRNVAILCNRAQAYIKLMEPNQGLKDAEKAIEIDKTFVKGWVRKGTCH